MAVSKPKAARRRLRSRALSHARCTLAFGFPPFLAISLYRCHLSLKAATEGGRSFQHDARLTASALTGPPWCICQQLPTSMQRAECKMRYQTISGKRCIPCRPLLHS